MAHNYTMAEVMAKKTHRALKACGLHWDQPMVRTREDLLAVCLRNGNSAAKRKARRAFALFEKMGG